MWCEEAPDVRLPSETNIKAISSGLKWTASQVTKEAVYRFIHWASCLDTSQVSCPLGQPMRKGHIHHSPRSGPHLCFVPFSGGLVVSLGVKWKESARHDRQPSVTGNSLCLSLRYLLSPNSKVQDLMMPYRLVPANHAWQTPSIS